MTMTPVHLVGHGHGLGAVGFVISVHIAGMYLPSTLTGWLADRYGRRLVLVTDATTPSNRARTQGAVDLTIALAGATGGIVSGTVVAATSYPLLALAGGALGLLILPVVLADRTPTRATT